MIGEKLFIWGLLTVAVIFLAIFWFNGKPIVIDENKVLSPMTLTSSAFEPGGYIPELYTCDGLNISPPLEFGNVPAQAKSLALVVNDPDAPSGNWVHWAVWNIPPTTVGVQAGEKILSAVEGLTSFGRNGYGGPCPPDGEHRYFFELYALDATLNLRAVFGIKLENAIKEHIIQKVELIGKYERLKQ